MERMIKSVIWIPWEGWQSYHFIQGPVVWGRCESGQSLILHVIAAIFIAEGGIRRLVSQISQLVIRYCCNLTVVDRSAQTGLPVPPLDS
jgi:hypothetical protein